MKHIFRIPSINGNIDINVLEIRQIDDYCIELISDDINSLFDGSNKILVSAQTEINSEVKDFYNDCVFENLTRDNKFLKFTCRYYSKVHIND